MRFARTAFFHGRRRLAAIWPFAAMFAALALGMALALAAAYRGLGVPQVRWAVLLFDALLLASPFLLGKKYRLWVILPLAAAIVLLLGLNWYYRQYGTLMPLGVFGMTGNFGIAARAVTGLMRWRDLLILLPPAAAIALLVYCRQRITVPPARCRAALLALILLIPAAELLRFSWRSGASYTRAASLDFKLVRIRALGNFGLGGYLLHDLGHGIRRDDVSPEELAPVRAFFAGQRPDSAAGPAAAAIGGPAKNFIVVVVESLDSYLLDYRPGGFELTPALNALARGPDAFFAPRILQQTRDGRSSDAYLLLNAGLLPLSFGAASFACAGNSFPTLLKALKQRGYATCDLMGASKNIWQHEEMSHAYGFDTVLDCRDLSPDGAPLEDGPLYEAALEVLRAAKRPFWAQIVTLSSHQPYDEEKADLPFPPEEVGDETFFCYLSSIAYADRALGEFIARLKDEGLYESSVIVIVGDHTGPFSRNFAEGREEKTSADHFVPLLILNGPVAGVRNDIFGQVDLYPTLLALAGRPDLPYRGLGTSLFVNRDNCAADTLGVAADGEAPEALVREKKELWRLSDLILRSDYFRRFPPKRGKTAASGK